MAGEAHSALFAISCATSHCPHDPLNTMVMIACRVFGRVSLCGVGEMKHCEMDWKWRRKDVDGNERDDKM